MEIVTKTRGVEGDIDLRHVHAGSRHLMFRVTDMLSFSSGRCGLESG